MTLTDDEVDLYSRHILIPEIGPHGQARLMATRVAIHGPEPLREFTSDLLGRSGLQIVPSHGDLDVAFGPPFATTTAPTCVVGWRCDEHLHATTLTTRPCIACWRPHDAPCILEASVVAPLGALVATVATLRALELASPSCDVHLACSPPVLAAAPLGGADCPRCAEERPWT